MNKAFLSHSSNQKEFVREVYNLLGPARCVIDECCFENGKQIIDEIVKQINNSNLFVLFISNDALNSDWVQKEIVLADNFKNSHDQKSILPILIDNNINPAKDPRIPNWMKGYLMNYVSRPNKAKDMIINALRQLEYDNNPIYKAKRNLFIGRYKEKEELESALNFYIDPHYRTLIVSGLEGIGRRTFLKRFFDENGFLDNYLDPIFISLGARSSIDDLSLRLFEHLNGVITDDFLQNLFKMNLEEKIEELKQHILNIIKDNSFIFIIDDGCIVRPTLEICSWFLSAIDIPELRGCFNISLISTFKPSSSVLTKYDDILSIPLGPLNYTEVHNLFNGYCRALNVKYYKGMDEIIECLNGIPAQIYYAVEMIHRVGIDMAIRNKYLIVDRGDRPVIPIINTIKERGIDSFDLFILLCTLQTTSYSMIYQIAGDTEFVNQELEFFNVAGIFSLYGSNKQYIEVNSSIADYVKRSRVFLKDSYNQKLNQIVESFMNRGLQDEEFSDSSILFHSIRGSILSGKEIPSYYYLPSFTLNAVSELYNNQKYESVIELIDRMLSHKNKYDRSTLREYTNWLCLSLARLKSKRFEKEVEFFPEGTEYFFLKGFYFRILRQLDKAEYNLCTALEYNPNHQRSKRELVNVYIMKNEYGKGLELAKENYNSKSTNPFHIQAYFICLLHKNINNINVVAEELHQLITIMKESLDRRAKSMLATMNGEYLYYVDHNLAKAIKVLSDAISTSTTNLFATKALAEIYRNEGMNEQLKELLQ